MSKQESLNIVSEFLISQMNMPLRRAYEMVASLQYPIADKNSFDQLLATVDEANGDCSEDQSVTSLISNTFTPFDFPVTSPQSALEKFQARLSFPERLVDGLLMPVPRDFPDEIQEPYFGNDSCGRAAQELYDQIVAEDRSYLPISLVRAGAYNSAHNFVNRCRVRNPYSGTAICDNIAALTFARCYAQNMPYHECVRLAGEAQASCRRFARPIADPVIPFPHDRTLPGG